MPEIRVFPVKRKFKMKPKRGGKRSQDRYYNRKQDSKRRKLDSEKEETAEIKYLRQIESRLNGRFESDEDKEIFISNVLKQIHDTLWDISCDTKGSRILEKLLPFANIDQIQPVTEVFKSNFRKACIHLNASHVTQVLMRKVYTLLTNDETEKDEEKKEVLSDWMISLSTFMLNNLTDFMFEPHASHVLQELVKLVSGFPQSDENCPVTEKLYSESIPKYVEQITEWKNLSDFLVNSSASGVLQFLIEATKNKDQKLCSKLLKFIVKQGIAMDEDEQNPNLSKFFSNECSSRVAEKVILSSSDETFDKLLNSHFKDQISFMATHKIANFVLQKLIKGCKQQEHVKIILEEVKKVLENIVTNGYFGIFVSLSQACVEHKTQQREFIEILLTAFKCSGNEDKLKIFPSIATTRFLKSNELSTFTNLPIKLQGSLLLQHLFLFNRPQTVVNSMLKMESSHLLHIASDKSGSFIFDAFVKSQLVGYKNKSKLIRALKGNYAELTCSIYGSRCLENIWNNADLNDRLIIVKELTQKTEKLKNDRFGRIAFKKFGLDTFQHRLNEWTTIQNSQIKNKKMFNEILA